MTYSWQYRLLMPLMRGLLRPWFFPVVPTPANLRARQRLSHLAERLLWYPWGVTIEPVALPRCRAEWVSTSAERTGRVVLQLHGGGYTVLTPRGYRDHNARLAEAARARVLAVDYRQGPDHPWPAPLDDALDAYRFLLDSGHEADDIVICGDSAGGHLTLCTVLALRDRGLPLPAGAIAMSPWANLACDYPSMEENRDRDVTLHTDALRALGRLLAQGRDLKSPEISPAFADFRDIPPLFLLASGREIARDDARAARDAALAAGVSVRYLEAPDMPHAWTALPTILPEGWATLREMAGFVVEVTRLARDRSHAEESVLAIRGV